MPRARPPRSTRAGHLHATAPQPPLPVQPATTPAAERATGPTPLAALHRPEPATTNAVASGPVLARRLDRGRLYASALIAAARWPQGPAALDADVSTKGRLRLRPAPDLHGDAARHRSRAHSDGARLVLPNGLRHHLQITHSGEVFALARPDGTVDIWPLAAVLAALETHPTPQGP